MIVKYNVCAGYLEYKKANLDIIKYFCLSLNSLKRENTKTAKKFYKESENQKIS